MVMATLLGRPAFALVIAGQFRQRGRQSDFEVLCPEVGKAVGRRTSRGSDIALVVVSA